jgi:hypothetical protein
MSYYPIPSKLIEKSFEQIHDQILVIYYSNEFGEKLKFILEEIKSLEDFIHYISSGEIEEENE